MDFFASPFSLPIPEYLTRTDFERSPAFTLLLYIPYPSTNYIINPSINYVVRRRCVIPYGTV